MSFRHDDGAPKVLQFLVIQNPQNALGSKTLILPFFVEYLASLFDNCFSECENEGIIFTNLMIDVKNHLVF